MSWDSKATTRRRQNSSAATGRSRGLSLHMRSGAPKPPSPPVKIDPKSAHTSDPFLQAFLNPAFDAADYLNSTLPPLQGSSLRSSSTTAKVPPSVPLADLSTEAQTLLTQLSAHTTRLTGTLSQLTEDILRSGGRLAYEVELLRGEALGLAEALADEGPLRGELERFAPAGGIQAAAAGSGRRGSLVSVPPTPAIETASSPMPVTPAATQDEPPYIAHLRTLTLVRARLDAVIKTFGEAMEFVFPPSEISVSSGFLSVSAPDFPDRAHEGQISTEDKGQQVLRKLREEVGGLLRGGATHEDKVKGVEDATRRVEEIKTLSTVWRGTAEEKGRQRFVESLARMVEERHRELVKELESQREKEVQGRKDDAGSRRDQAGPSDATATESRGPLGGYGFMNQWQKIRGGL